MGSVETALKQEIARLSRRETRAMTSKYVEEVRRLRKRVGALESELEAIKSAQAKERAKIKVTTVAQTVASTGDLQVRLSPGLIRKLRRRLNISQPQLAKLVGVSPAAVGFWETGASAPKPESKARIVALRALGRRDVKRLLAEQDA